MTSEKMEFKAYKLLAQIRKDIIWKIQNEARNRIQYCKEKPEEFAKLVEYISNPGKWDYCGLLNKEDKRVLEVVEYLLNDDMDEIRKYESWEPTES